MGSARLAVEAREKEVRGSPYQRYENAVKLEEATYVTQAAPDPTFIYWSRDPVALKDLLVTNLKCLQAV